MSTIRAKNHFSTSPFPTNQTKRIPIGKMSNSKAPPLGTGACNSLRSGQQTAGLPSVEMLSTPPLVARLLQIKTHTYAHTLTRTHCQRLPGAAGGGRTDGGPADARAMRLACTTRRQRVRGFTHVSRPPESTPPRVSAQHTGLLPLTT
mgnify:CR=1 FL=1